MQVECEPAPIAWDGIIPALTSGKVDMILGSLSITEERKQTIAFSDRYYYTASTFVAPKGSGIDISPEGMKGKILGVQSSRPTPTMRRRPIRTASRSNITTRRTR